MQQSSIENFTQNPSWSCNLGTSLTIYSAKKDNNYWKSLNGSNSREKGTYGSFYLLLFLSSKICVPSMPNVRISIGKLGKKKNYLFTKISSN